MPIGRALVPIAKSRAGRSMGGRVSRTAASSGSRRIVGGPPTSSSKALVPRSSGGSAGRAMIPRASGRSSGGGSGGGKNWWQRRKPWQKVGMIGGAGIAIGNMGSSSGSRGRPPAHSSGGNMMM